VLASLAVMAERWTSMLVPLVQLALAVLCLSMLVLLVQLPLMVER